MTAQAADIGVEITGEDSDGPEIIRAKWAMDGAATLAEAAARLRERAAELDQLHADGWTLQQPVEDDCGFLVAPPAA